MEYGVQGADKNGENSVRNKDKYRDEKKKCVAFLLATARHFALRPKTATAANCTV